MQEAFDTEDTGNLYMAYVTGMPLIIGKSLTVLKL